MTFEQTRRELIYIGNENSRTPCMKHRPFTVVEQLKHLQAPVDRFHEKRLLVRTARQTREMEAAKRNNMNLDPAHCRSRPYTKVRR